MVLAIRAGEDPGDPPHDWLEAAAAAASGELAENYRVLSVTNDRGRKTATIIIDFDETKENANEDNERAGGDLHPEGDEKPEAAASRPGRRHAAAPDGS
jgi:hypothetical protein